MMGNDFLGTLPGWISAGASVGILGILGLLVRWQLGMRKLQVQAQQVQVNAAQVDHADVADIRDHYAQELQALRQRLDEQAERHRAAMLVADQRHEECVREREELRRQITGLEDKLTGIIRQFVTYSQRVAMAIPPAQRSPEVQAAMEILQPLIDGMSGWRAQ